MTKIGMNKMTKLLVLMGLALFAAPNLAATREQDPAYSGDLSAQQIQAMTSFIAYRESARKRRLNALKISTPNGIEVREQVEINGLEHAILARGTDKNNPLLLYLHGGPGAVTMPFAYAMSPEWEQQFIMVHWDQRGTGKTRCANPHYRPQEATFEDFFSDTVKMVNYLIRRFDKQKIIVVGHSWGSLLGAHLAKKHPELLYAYVGTGQMTNTIESETLGYEFALEKARGKNDSKALEALESIAPYPPTSPVETKELQRKISTQRGHLQKFGGALKFDYMERIYYAFFNSPEYSLCDWMGFINTQLGGEPYPHRDLTGSFLQQEAGIANFDADLGFKFDIPIFFFLGRDDYQTSTIVAERYFERIDAPSKKLLIFEKSAHAPPFTEEKVFIKALVEHVRGLAL